jgi:hypothetical protein
MSSSSLNTIVLLMIKDIFLAMYSSSDVFFSIHWPPLLVDYMIDTFACCQVPEAPDAVS